MWLQNEPRAPPQGRLLLVLQANEYSPASTDETYTRSMSEPLDTTPCRRPSASSTNGTLASLRGCAGGITRAVLDSSQSANGHLLHRGGLPRRNGGMRLNLLAATDKPGPTRAQDRVGASDPRPCLSRAVAARCRSRSRRNRDEACSGLSGRPFWNSAANAASPRARRVMAVTRSTSVLSPLGRPAPAERYTVSAAPSSWAARSGWPPSACAPARPVSACATARGSPSFCAAVRHCRCHERAAAGSPRCSAIKPSSDNEIVRATSGSEPILRLVRSTLRMWVSATSSSPSLRAVWPRPSSAKTCPGR